MVRGSTRDEPSGHSEVNNLQETEQASLLFWFFFRQCDAVSFSSECWVERYTKRDCPRYPGPSSRASLEWEAGKVRFFTFLFCQIVNTHYKESGFSPKATDLFSRIQNLKFPESSALNPFSVGRRPLLVTQGIAAMLYQPLQMLHK